MKKWFLLLIGLLVFTGCKSASEDKKKNSSEGLEFKLNETEDGYEVSGIDDYSYNEVNLVIPSTYNNFPVTMISDEAFSNCKTLTSIEIPKSIVFIGEKAFKECTNLLKIKFDDNCDLTYIEEEAFYGCTSLTSFTIPKSVNDIDSSAFENCTNLKTVEFEKGNNYTYIESQTFYGCKSLSSISIPKNVTSIDNRAFAECTNLKTIEFETASELNHIGISAFYKCSSLEAISIPNNVYYLGSEAFSECESLTSIKIPSGLNYISDKMFEKCTNLKTVEFRKDCDLTTIYEEAFKDCTSLTSINIPDSVIDIHDFAFKNCSSLTSIRMSNRISLIGKEIFYGCDSLNYNEYGNCLYLGNEENPYLALVNVKDTSITEATISDNTKIIASGAFDKCKFLTYLYIPKNVTKIQMDTFSNCKSLKLYLEVKTRPEDWYFSLENFVEKVYWGVEKSNFIVQDGLHFITKNGNKAIVTGHNTNIKDVIIPATLNNNGSLFYVTEIDSLAFNGCDYLTSLVIPGRLTNLDVRTFANCTSLNSVTFEEDSNLKRISDYAFLNCTSLTSINIPDSLSRIGNNAFYNCRSLKSIYIPRNVTNTGDRTFYNCSSLSSVTFGENSLLTTIGENAFLNCSSLTSINIPNGVTSIGNNAFLGCSLLTSITIPNGIQEIGCTAFDECDSLQYNEYENGLYLGNEVNPYLVFVKAKNENVTDVTISNQTKIILDKAFSNSSIQSITIPKSVTYVGKYAFNNCSSIIIYCEEENALESWSDSWVINAGPVYWGVKQKIIQDGIIYIISGDQIIATGCTEELSTKVKINSQIKVDEKIYEVSIGKALFRGNTSIESITLPFIGSSLDQPTHFGYLFGAYSFDMNSKCVPSSLKKVTITGGSTILDYAFYGCSSLKNIVISNSVTHIGGNAFKNCSNLTIYCEVSSIPSGWNSNWNPSNCPVYWSNEWKYVNGVPTLN